MDYIYQNKTQDNLNSLSQTSQNLSVNTQNRLVICPKQSIMSHNNNETSIINNNTFFEFSTNNKYQNGMKKGMRSGNKKLEIPENKRFKNQRNSQHDYIIYQTKSNIPNTQVNSHRNFVFPKSALTAFNKGKYNSIVQNYSQVNPLLQNNLHNSISNVNSKSHKNLHLLSTK